ncbi:MAG: nucleotidyltransferase family protein [Bacteroidales bacterium]|jgi:predicted nucleotidyltransferase|nr:nucleotidyltransferase family protein [Bacteroidales bacterium]
METKSNIVSNLRQIKPQLVSIGVSNIGLFGSVVKSMATENSDIDILLDFEPQKETYLNYLASCELLESTFRNEHLDIVTKNGLSPHIGKYILNEVEYV